ncbi:MAG: hypothetical protein M3Q39_16010 [Actinomycetota bacterium]|nr:hypothetical protein [Actinomycetota bacterium]
MSVCTSPQGEYGSHEPGKDDPYLCVFCGAVDEQLMLQDLEATRRNLDQLNRLLTLRSAALDRTVAKLDCVRTLALSWTRGRGTAALNGAAVLRLVDDWRSGPSTPTPEALAEFWADDPV